ncbi:MAG: DHH family phosphoesterase [Oscillospiraceae bacterium]|nr:DHH family phosphoesterase [Oscillospiraceae bacterium]
MNKALRRLTKPDWLPYLLLAAFAGAALYVRYYWVAAAAAGTTVLLLIVSLISWRRRTKRLAGFMESALYDTESAKSSTLMSFPLPIAIFALEDSRIIWGNTAFFDMCGEAGTRLDANLAQLVPQFSGKWLLEGKSSYPALLEVNGRKYRLHGSIVHSEQDTELPPENRPIMGITYWVDVTDYDNIRIAFEDTRPVAGVIVIDNLDELVKNVPERVKNDLRDAVEEKLGQWCGAFQGIIRRYDRDRYLLLLEHQAMERLKPGKFSIVEEIHSVVNPFGIAATISIGLGADCETLGDALQAADNAAELALSRGGDQTVIKNRMGFEFYGGRGGEVETRAKVRSRVMANALAELIRESSRLYVMGHRFGDMDSLGAAAGVCAIARQLGVRCEIVADLQHTAALPLADHIRGEEAYRDVIIAPSELPVHIDPSALLVVVDTNRPEQLEVPALLDSCGRVAVIDHHRVAATYIQDPALSFIEPYASSACELVAGMLQDLPELGAILPCEAEALMAGIVLDTKNFTLRTGERTFDAASWLRRSGADTSKVKRLFQADLAHMVAKYRILEQVEIYRQIAVAAPKEAQDRVVAAMAADDMLNIMGVAASIVLAPDGRGGCFASARSIGNINVQLIMEALGGGGNRNAAAMQMPGVDTEEALKKLYAAIDDYLNDENAKR